MLVGSFVLCFGDFVLLCVVDVELDGYLVCFLVVVFDFDNLFLCVC